MYVLNCLEFDVFGIVFFLYLFYHVFAKCVGEGTDSSQQVNLLNYIYDSENEEKPTTKGKPRRRRTRRKKKQKRDSDYTKKDVLDMIKLLLRSKLVTKEFGVEYYKQKPDVGDYPEPKTPQGKKPTPDPVKYQIPPKVRYPVYEPEPAYKPELKSTPPPEPDVQPEVPPEPETIVIYDEPKTEIQRYSPPPLEPEPKITYYLEPDVEAYPDISFPSITEPPLEPDTEYQEPEPEIQRISSPPREPEPKITYYLEPNVETYPEISFPSITEPPLEPEIKMEYESQPVVEYKEPVPEIQQIGPPPHEPELKITYSLESSVEAHLELGFPSSSEPQDEQEIKRDGSSKSESKISYYLEADVQSYSEVIFPSSSEPLPESEISIKYQSQLDAEYSEYGPDDSLLHKLESKISYYSESFPKLELPSSSETQQEPEFQPSGSPPHELEPKITYSLEPDVKAYPEISFPSISEPPLEPDTEYQETEPEIQQISSPPHEPEPKITYSLEPDVKAYPEISFPSISEPPLEPDTEYQEPEPGIQRISSPPHEPEPKITYSLEPDVEAYPEISFPSISEPPLEPEIKMEYESQPDTEYQEPEPEIQQIGSPLRKPESKISYHLEPDVETYPELMFPPSSEPVPESKSSIKYQSEPGSEYTEPRPETLPDLQDDRIPSPEPVIKPDIQDEPKTELAPLMYFQPEMDYEMPPDTPTTQQPQQEIEPEPPRPVPKPQLDIKQTVVKRQFKPDLESKEIPLPEMSSEMPPAPDTPVTQPQREVSAEPEPVAKPRLVSKKTVVKGQFKPKLEPVPEPIRESEPDLRPEPVPQPRTQTPLQPKLEPDFQPELKPVKTDSKLSLKLKTQYEIEMKPKFEPRIELPPKVSEPEIKLQTETETQTNVKVELEAGHHHVTKLQLETDAERQHVTELQLKTACQCRREFQVETECEHVTDLQLEFVSQHMTKLQIVTETKHKHMTNTDHRHVTEVQLKNVIPPQSHQTKPESEHKPEPEYQHSPEPEYKETITEDEPTTDVDQLDESESDHQQNDIEAKLLQMREHQHKTQYHLEADSNTDIQLQFNSYAMCDHMIELGRDSVYQSEPELWRSHKYETAAKHQWHASETLLQQHTQHRYVPERKCEHGNETWLKAIKRDQIETRSEDEHVALLKNCIGPEHMTQYMFESDTGIADRLVTELQIETDTESEPSYIETKKQTTDHQYIDKSQSNYMSDFQIECVPSSHLFSDLVAGRDTEHWNMSALMSEAQTDHQSGMVPNLPQCKTKDDTSGRCIDYQQPFNLHAETQDNCQHVSDSELITDTGLPHLIDSQHEILCPFVATTPTSDQERPSYPGVSEESNQNNANRFILTLIIPYS